MRENFEKALALVLKHEGGYVNHPRDPGGATNFGITQIVYNGFRVLMGKPSASVKAITLFEVKLIYKKQYWDAVKGDELPAGLDYAVFDYAVNSGVRRASRKLQEAVGAKVDGHIGFATLSLARKQGNKTLINVICNERLAFMKRLKTWDTFGKGWESRVLGVKKHAHEMA